ncbi:restriction endonuclease-like protein [Paraburkholderia sp. MMS20-SJTN17]|uniref:Restriction endonuclease-like protein n=1 Tax=Paraburkholderia translucens TaxID=2886945 RepID=A0ABS8KB55_9BURK|nr:DUF2357 domain-containing protein [Paraburkholderia sp. MMS20-SJTN17]MCC8402003.1 restriction endonuclease-like protein [Paraburkholderia sp. MMS20-SJTN17]
MNDNISGPPLLVRLVGSPAAPTTYYPGDTITGLRECEKCVFEILDVYTAQLFVDDVEVRADKDGRYEWTPTFYAGRVEIGVSIHPDADTVYYAQVGPSSEKTGDEQFETMVREIRDFRASLLLGETSAAMSFGNDPAISPLDNLVRLTRLKRYAPVFLREARAICRVPHRSLLQADRLISLARAKRLHPLALREPRLAAIVAGHAIESASLDSIRVATSTPVQTFDTPSNRALKALVTKVKAQATDLLAAVYQGQFGGNPEEQALRRPRRERLLQRLVSEANSLLTREPFRSVSRLETSAASLTQIAAQPAYSSAYRHGTRALLRGVEGTSDQDHLHVSPTWGVYETWSFVHLLSRLAEKLGPAQWKSIRNGIVSAAESYSLELTDGIRLEAHFQANFPAGAPSSNRAGWSLSRLRIPDIVLAIQTPTRFEFLVLDAKYRRKRDNVLEAMESAHIYHDSLRVHHHRPTFCALLLPAVADVPSLDVDSFLHEHGVGTISQFLAGDAGVKRCVDLITSWGTGTGALQLQPD